MFEAFGQKAWTRCLRSHNFRRAYVFYVFTCLYMFWCSRWVPLVCYHLRKFGDVGSLSDPFWHLKMWPALRLFETRLESSWSLVSLGCVGEEFGWLPALLRSNKDLAKVPSLALGTFSIVLSRMNQVCVCLLHSGLASTNRRWLSVELSIRVVLLDCRLRLQIWKKHSWICMLCMLGCTWATWATCPVAQRGALAHGSIASTESTRCQTFQIHKSIVLDE